MRKGSHGRAAAGKSFWLLLLAAALLAGGCAGRQLPVARAPLPPAGPGPAIGSPVRPLLEAQLAAWRGVPYRRGGLSRQGVDCSGFVYLTFREKLDLALPRTTAGLAAAGARIRRAALASGDLVFFKTGRARHVGIFLGGDRFIHASTSRGVTSSSLANDYWAKRFWQARRVLPAPAKTAAAGR